MPPPSNLRAPREIISRTLSPTRGSVSRLPAIYKTANSPPASTSPATPRPLHTSSSGKQTPFAKLTTPQSCKMSTMPATGGHSQPCCNIPPVVSEGYKDKGDYEQINNIKTYATGPKDADKGILVIMDIFGFFPQTIQGADILATSDDKQKYKVFIPDWFDGEPCPTEWYPPDNKEKQEKLGGFFQKNPPPGVAKKIPEYVKAAQEKNPSIKSWGIVGFCWGGKVVSLVTSSASNPFSVGAECHPAMVDPNDAAGIKVPLIMLASKDEEADSVQKFEKSLTGPKHVETFGDQVHGWMAARADLSDSRVKDEYTRGYKTLLEFFDKHWK